MVIIVPCWIIVEVALAAASPGVKRQPLGGLIEPTREERVVFEFSCHVGKQKEDVLGYFLRLLLMADDATGSDQNHGHMAFHERMEGFFAPTPGESIQEITIRRVHLHLNMSTAAGDRTGKSTCRRVSPREPQRCSIDKPVNSTHRSLPFRVVGACPHGGGDFKPHRVGIGTRRSCCCLRFPAAQAYPFCSDGVFANDRGWAWWASRRWWREAA